MKLRVLSAQDVRQALSMADCIVAMRSAFGQLSAGQAELPLRTRIETPDGTLLFMPAYLKESQAMGFKFVSVWPNNPSRGLPMVNALVTVISAETGQPVALINGEALTYLRTGAGGGLSADLLARPEASTVAVFGAGVQARAQLEAVCTVRNIEEVRLVGRSAKNVERFAQEISHWAPPPVVSIASSKRVAVNGADIIIAATTSNTPVFEGSDVTPGTHIIGVGSYRADMQEVDATTVQYAKVVVDSLTACLAEAGDLVIPLKQGLIKQEHLHGELGAIINGELVARESAEEITFFKSVGVAVQDAASAQAIFQAAEAQNLGQMISL